MKGGLIFVILLMGGLLANGQLTFQKTYFGYYALGRIIRQTTDGGYAIQAGAPNNVAGYVFVRLNRYGDTLWSKRYSGTYQYNENSFQQTSDEGFIITATAYPSAFSDTCIIYLIKTNSTGDTLWTKVFGRVGYQERCYSVNQTTDGGYVVAGITTDGGVGVYLFKTDANGNTLWRKSYLGLTNQVGYSMQQTTDGGFVIAGSTGAGAGGGDIILIRTDSSGGLLWTKTYGGVNSDVAYSVQQTIDGGYIIGGETNSFGAGGNDIYLIKTNASGTVQWSKAYGGDSAEYSWSVRQTNDGGFIIAGSTISFGAGAYDAYLIKTAANGNLLWSKTYGGVNGDVANYAVETFDGGYIATGYYHYSPSQPNIYVIKTDSLGNSGCNESIAATIVTTPSTITTTPTTFVNNLAYYTIRTLYHHTHKKKQLPGVES